MRDAKAFRNARPSLLSEITNRVFANDSFFYDLRNQRCKIILLIILNRFLSDGAWREVVLVIASVQADSVDVGLTPKSADARALLHR